MSVGVALVLLATGVGCSRGQATGQTRESPEAAQKVQVGAVRVESIHRAVEVVGTLAAEDEVTLSAQAEGQVSRIVADLGDRVTAGHALIALDREKSQYTFDRQSGVFASALARYGTSDLEHLPRIEDTPGVQKALAELQQARQSALRAEALSRRQLLAQQALDDAHAALRVKEAIYAGALQRAKDLRAEIDASAAATKLAERQLRDTTIRTPFDATVSAADAQASPQSASPAGSDHFSIRLSGKIQLDAAFFEEDRARIGNSQEARRVRLQAAGTIDQNWLYSLELDFSSSASLNEASISYAGFKDVRINLGYVKVPFSLDYQTSNSYILFQERSLLQEAFISPRRIGASVEMEKGWGSGFTAELGVFGQTIPADTEPDSDSGVSVAGRTTYAPLHTDVRLLHVGSSVEWRNPGHGESVQLRTRPGAHLAPRLVDTGVIPGVDDVRKLGAEFAGVAGPLSVQGEYTTEQVNRQTGGHPNFSGWYAQAGYFLTDDSQAATYTRGIFGRIDPHGRYGAWQLALRYDAVDLTDANIIGGEEANLTAGLNWYATRNTRMSMNYVKVLKLERPGSPHDGDKPGILVARVWLYF